jgi:iron complex outermembrane receptor protein
VDVLYGPFAAQYAGNSIGAVVEFQTRMPDAFIATARAQMAVQDYDQYGTHRTYPAYELSGLAGDRSGAFSWRASLNHLDSRSHPLAYATATRPASTSAAGTPVTGAFGGFNRTGAPIAVLGAGGLEYQRQDNATVKFAYDIAPEIEIAYTAGLFLNDDRSGVETYLRNAAGAPVYAGSVNIGGYNYSIGAGAFSNNVYSLQEEHWMHSISLRSDTGGEWDWSLIGTSYNYDNDIQRLPSTALPGAYSGGAGSIVDMGGTGWYTADAKATWRLFGADGANIVSFGGHFDRYTLANLRFATADWRTGPKGTLSVAAKGHTETYAFWLQDVWRLMPDLTLTAGGRFESWRAFDGFNYAASPALSVNQPHLNDSTFSPKASLAWQFDPQWKVTASFGSAYRFPTVSELYQTVTTGAVLSVPNPDLKPEHALSSELAIERMTERGRVRVSLFSEDIDNALISQSAPLLPGSATLFNYIQNIDHVQTLGIELVAEQTDVLIDGLDLSGSVTYVDPRITSDPVFPAAEGKRIPQVPAWRWTAVATYRPDAQWAFTFAARYSSRVYGTIDNSDFVTHTYQGFEDYLVFDARVNYQIDSHWNAAVGIDNLTAQKYFLFHPFPQRTFIAELRYSY